MIKIKKFESKDYDALADIYNSTTLFYNLNEFNEEQKKVTVLYEKDKEYELKKFVNSLTLVAFDNSEIVGFIVMRKNGYINYLYVKKDKVQQGIGKKLIFELEKKAKEQGLTKVYLHSSEYALNFYKKLGFNDLGKKNHKICKVIFNQHRMEKFLL